MHYLEEVFRSKKAGAAEASWHPKLTRFCPNRKLQSLPRFWLISEDDAREQSFKNITTPDYSDPPSNPPDKPIPELTFHPNSSSSLSQLFTFLALAGSYSYEHSPGYETFQKTRPS